MQIISLAIATAIPLLFLFIIYKLDLYKTGEFRTVLICFLYGGLAFVAAYFLNRSLIRLALISNDNMVRFSAPIVEEILKAAILIYLVRRPNFTYFVDGAIYGFAAGIGFAIFENYQYILGTSGTALAVAIGRVLSTNLIHASASATVGIAFGLARFERGSKRIVVIGGGLFLAMILHMAFNNLVTRLNSGLLLLFAAVFGFGGAIFIAAMIKRGLAEEKTWIEEKLGAADRVTSSEATAVQQLSNLKQVLAPVVERFGSQKAAQIEQFLTIQARLGIQRKTLDKLTDEKMKKAVEVQMESLRKEMNVVRRQVGSYCMLYLRHTFLDDTAPLWGRLETLIQERAAARPAQGGANLWDKLGERAAQAAGPSNAAEKTKP